MRVSNSLSLLLAAAGTQVAAQTSTSASSSSAAPSSTIAPTEPVTGKLGNANVVANNPPGVVYKATLPDVAFFKDAYPDGGNIKGEVSAVANSDGKGVVFTLKLSNLPKTGGPFTYHLHVDPVPQNGNCTATLAHLDPFIRGETPPCDSKLPETCQVGDLSGKHGAIPAGQVSFETSYTELYASTLDGIGAFFGNRSIVFHYPNKTRITCASFQKAAGIASLPSSTSSSVAAPTATGWASSSTGGGNATVTSGGNGSSTSKPAGPTTSSQLGLGDASSVRAGVASAVVFGAAVLFMF